MISRLRKIKPQRQNKKPSQDGFFICLIDLYPIDLYLIDFYLIDLQLIDLYLIDLYLIDLQLIDLQLTDLYLIDLQLIDLQLIDLYLIYCILFYLYPIRFAQTFFLHALNPPRCDMQNVRLYGIFLTSEFLYVIKR